MAPAPSRAATARMLTASRPSASAMATAAATISAGACRGRRPRRAGCTTPSSVASTDSSSRRPDGRLRPNYRTLYVNPEEGAMTTTTPTTSTGRYDPLPLWSRALGRLGRSTMPAPRHRAGVERDLRIHAGDVTLVADHFAPLTADPCPTLLVRSPYGRGFPWSQFLGVNLV